MDKAKVLRASLGNLTVDHGEDIVGNLEWKNGGIGAGTPLLVGFIVLMNGTIFEFEHDGVKWYGGSLIEVGAPGLNETRTDSVPSKAAWWWDNPFSAWAFVSLDVDPGDDPISILKWEDRIIGINALDFISRLYLSEKILDIRVFPDVLTVNPPPLQYGRLFGRITDLDTGAGIAGALIEIWGPGGQYSTLSLGGGPDMDGWYEIRNIESGTYQGRVTADGYEEYTI